jgi:hypothetical protein
VLCRYVADPPRRETNNTKVSTVAGRLLGQDQLNEVPRPWPDCFVRSGKGMMRRRDRNKPNATNFDSLESNHVHVQYASDANASSTAADHAFDTAQRLNQQANRHRRIFRVKISEQCDHAVTREHTVNDERHLRLKLVEKTPYSGA